MKIRSKKSLILALTFLLLLSASGLGIVYVDGVNVNIELVEKGHAEEYEEGEE